MLNLNCVICAELFTPSDGVHVTTCGHMFHYVCLKQWMERSKSCPQCRNKCTDRNIFRVYFNLANLDVSRIDVGSLQEQLDDAKLKLKIKEKEANKVEENLKNLKETQKKCMETIVGLDQKLQKNDFLILSYNEQIKLLKADATISDDLRKEVKSLKSQIEALESVSTILTASKPEIEKMLKNESNPQKLALWVTTYKRELRISENKRTDVLNVLKKVQNYLRKEIELKKNREERISQLESDNYRLNEKIKALEIEFSVSNTRSSVSATSLGATVNNALLAPLKREDNRISISPTAKENIKKIEESNSPYLNIKSSSVGLVPLFKCNHETAPTSLEANTKATTTKLATQKLSPVKSSASLSGAICKTSSGLSEKIRITVNNATSNSVLMEKLYSDFMKRKNCDWCLRFQINTTIEVHSAVLKTCKNYFSNLEKYNAILDGKVQCVVVMPKEAKPVVFDGIINFLYTGSLKFEVNIFHEIYEMAKIMGLDDLMALMNSHMVVKMNQTKPDDEMMRMDYLRPSSSKRRREDYGEMFNTTLTRSQSCYVRKEQGRLFTAMAKCSIQQRRQIPELH